jgi:hypothetical protein
MTFAERSTLRCASICPFAETLLVRFSRSTLPNVTGVPSLLFERMEAVVMPPIRIRTTTTMMIFVLRFMLRTLYWMNSYEFLFLSSLLISYGF